MYTSPVTNECFLVNFFFFSAADHWFTSPGLGWGYHEFIPLADLRDSWKGFVLNDVLIVEVEMEAISSTKYFPS